MLKDGIEKVLEELIFVKLEASGDFKIIKRMIDQALTRILELVKLEIERRKNV